MTCRCGVIGGANQMPCTRQAGHASELHFDERGYHWSTASERAWERVVELIKRYTGLVPGSRLVVGEQWARFVPPDGIDVADGYGNTMKLPLSHVEGERLVQVVPYPAQPLIADASPLTGDDVDAVRRYLDVRTYGVTEAVIRFHPDHAGHGIGASFHDDDGIWITCACGWKLRVRNSDLATHGLRYLMWRGGRLNAGEPQRVAG